ncbi:MAG: hypothetical protein RL375_4101, partial [Pseudomonadota bacterium]
DVSDSVESVSLDTFVLGRHGYVAMNLMTRLDQLQRHGPSAVTLLEAIEFDVGKRYADASEAGDRRAAHGLAALVTGVPAQQAAAGPDLLALAGTHTLALAIGLALAGSAALWAVLRRRQSPAQAGATTPRT